MTGRRAARGWRCNASQFAVGARPTSTNLSSLLAEDDHVADDVAVGRHRDVVLGPGGVEAGEAVDREALEETRRVGPLDDQLVHVVRLVEQHRAVAPGALLVAPVGELGATTGYTYMPILEFAQHVDGVPSPAGRLQTGPSRRASHCQRMYTFLSRKRVRIASATPAAINRRRAPGPAHSPLRLRSSSMTFRGCGARCGRARARASRRAIPRARRWRPRCARCCACASSERAAEGGHRPPSRDEGRGRGEGQPRSRARSRAG